MGRRDGAGLFAAAPPRLGSDRARRLATRVQPTCVDPGNQPDQQSVRILRNSYEQLVQELQGSMNLGPGLATRWEVASDLKSITFHLRPNVKFADGTPFNAEAVRFSFDRIKKLGLYVASILAPPAH